MRFPPLLNTVTVIFFILFSCPLFSQTKCVVCHQDSCKGFIYNEQGLEEKISFLNFEAVFFGESHTTDFEPVFKLHFIKHLNRLMGVRNVFMETGISAAYFFNRYLETGDSTFLSNNRGIYKWGKYKIFWEQLYLFNKTLPDSLRIRIHALDFERKEALSLLYGLRKGAIPRSLKSAFDLIEEMKNDASLTWTDKAYKSGLSRICKEMLANPLEVKDVYKENAEIIFSVLNNKTPVTYKAGPRNKYWAQRIQETTSAYGIKRFICFAGKAHLSYDNPGSVLRILKQTPFSENRILLINSLYHHFKSMGYMGEAPKIFEYEYGTEETYKKHMEENCRAIVIPVRAIQKKNIRNKADYILFAKEIAD